MMMKGRRKRREARTDWGHIFKDFSKRFISSHTQGWRGSPHGPDLTPDLVEAANEKSSLRKMCGKTRENVYPKISCCNYLSSPDLLIG